MMTELFHQIQDAQVILAKNGVYKQVPLFHRGEKLYASAGGGFIRVSKTGTSQPGWVNDGFYGLEDGELEFDAIGWAVYPPGRKTVAKLKAV